MIRFPSRDRRGGDLLGLGFGGGEHIHNLLGLWSMVAGVGDGGLVAEMLRSMMATPLGSAEAITWLMPSSPITDKGITPSVQP
jgi:hypothetical protein